MERVRDGAITSSCELCKLEAFELEARTSLHDVFDKESPTTRLTDLANDAAMLVTRFEICSRMCGLLPPRFAHPRPDEPTSC